MNIHFIAGLPRSGSTLLAAILAQNPEFSANVSTPLLDLVTVMRERMSPSNDASSIMNDKQRKAILQGIFRDYYIGLEDKVIFDTNRVWTTYSDLCFALFPEAKIIACVRQIPWVIDSFELVTNRTPWVFSKLVDPNPRGTVFTRVNNLMGEYSMVGASLAGLSQAMGRCHPHQLILVRYESLSTDPRGTMKTLYEFLGLSEFDHDYNNLHGFEDATTMDDVLGVPGLHDVKPTVVYEGRMTLLPPGLFKDLEKHTFWENPESNPRCIPII